MMIEEFTLANYSSIFDKSQHTLLKSFQFNFVFILFFNIEFSKYSDYLSDICSIFSMAESKGKHFKSIKNLFSSFKKTIYTIKL